MTDTAPHDHTLTVAQVADELGVHYMTAYRYIRLGLLDAHQVGRSWVVARADLDAFKTDDTNRKPSARGEADWAERLRKRMLAGDESGAWSTVEAALSSGMSVSDIYMTMLVPSLRDIGELWQTGHLDVSDEHTASRIADRIISRLGPRVKTRGVKRGTIILGSTATEMHAIPLAITADLLRAARFNVLDLGVNLPPESFANAVEHTDSVVAVAIGVTMSGQTDELRATLQAIKKYFDYPIVVGGRGTDSTTALALGADAYAPTALDAVSAIDRLLDENEAEELV